jgi:hypothetical protein
MANMKPVIAFLALLVFVERAAFAQVSCPGGGTCPSGTVCEQGDPEWCCTPNNCAVSYDEGLNSLNKYVPCGPNNVTNCTGQPVNCGNPCPSYGAQWSCSNETYCTCAPMAAAQACAQAGQDCGNASDGCGGTAACGACAAGQECTTANTCCTPTTCAAQGAECGSIADQCGGTLSCGACSGGASCSEAFQCVGGKKDPPADPPPVPAVPGGALVGLASLLAVVGARRRS